MDIDITKFVTDGETWDCSGSVMTHGPNVAQNTWNAAQARAKDGALLATDDALEAMRAWMKSTGAWDANERAAMSDVELNALFIQLVTGDMRECGLEDCEIEDFDWDTYYEQAQSGRISGSLYKSDDDKIYYSLDA